MKHPDPTPLEAALLLTLCELYADRGFPAPDKVRVRHRENSGGGRYVSLDAEIEVGVSDGSFDLGGKYIEMAGVPHGLLAVVSVKHGTLEQLEIAVYGNDPWDGEDAPSACARGGGVVAAIVAACSIECLLAVC